MVAEPWNGPLTEASVINEFNNTRVAITNLHGEITQRVIALTKQGEAVGQLYGDVTNIKATIESMNAKIDSIKAAADINDNYVKQKVDEKTADMTSKITVITDAGNKTWETVTGIQSELGITNGRVASVVSSIEALLLQRQEVRSHVINGTTSAGGSGSGTHHYRSIMEYKCISYMDKLTREATGFHVWCLRLKNTLKQVNSGYAPILDLIAHSRGYF